MACLAVFYAPNDFLLAEVGAVQERDIDEDVVVGLHDVLGLRAEYGAPLQPHDSLQSEVPVCILELIIVLGTNFYLRQSQPQVYKSSFFSFSFSIINCQIMTTWSKITMLFLSGVD